MLKQRIRIFLVLLLLLGLISVFSYSDSYSNFIPMKESAWRQLPENKRFNFTVKDYAGVRILGIAGYLGEKRLLEKKMGDVDVLLSMFNIYWPNREFLVVYVGPIGDQYFYPSEFTFTQDISQYDVSPYDDMMSITDMFSGGELKAGTAVVGIIAIPEGIDLSKQFKIWYDDDSATLEFTD